ncbi:hypothetical protein CCO03_11760 [Comamonas serinivorans]|uniref:Uncharacterized protein n=1 Tax=Comamonas serinivorans TaxID=1082851 RepID=A0A1Y0ENP9_9BURK|nr:hypothetical protein [Comamonas serinivorans]ARU05265.1 hypothetical protein CCO03_11760 [Comamonas serinivorans]
MTMRTLNLLAASVLGLGALMSTSAFAQPKAQRAAAPVECGANSDPAACRKEAAAARAAARSGALTQGDFKANALARCEVVPPADRDTCRRRVESGQSSGSVEAGGTLTELREQVPAKQP